MDIEQLKLILDTLSAAGDGAKDIALLYIGYQYFSSLCVVAVLGGLLIGAYKLFCRLADNIKNLQWLSELLEVDLTTYISPSKEEQIKKIIEKGRKAIDD